MLDSELLAPAGNYLSAYSALLAGADAVYLGGKNFSARMASQNFTDDELIKIVVLAHLLKKKVYVTMNTLLFQDEFLSAYEYAKFLNKIKVDGLIIQDLGLAYYLHQRLPFLPLHASTQLSCHNKEEALALKKLGFVRIVLAREAPLTLIREIKDLGVEVEVFVHGALCVSYSGSCYLSSFIGGRSGNRGRCAQPCREKYHLVSDSQDYGEAFFLSTKDLNTLKYLKDLIEIGADSLKIEGRLKSQEYVYLVTLGYRHAIDEICLGKKNSFAQEDQENIKSIFSRTFTKGYINNESPFHLLNQNYSSHQGEKIGNVLKATSTSITVKLTSAIEMHDGVRLILNGKEKGFLVTSLYVDNKLVKSAKKGETVTIKNLQNVNSFKNADLYLTNKISLVKKVENGLKEKLKGEIEAILYLKAGEEMVLLVPEFSLSIKGDIVDKAINSSTSKEKIISQMAKSATYPFYLKTEIKIEGDVFVNMSSLNTLRNQALEKINNLLYQFDDVKEYPYSAKSVPSDSRIKIKVINYSNEKLNIENEVYNLGREYHLREEDNINIVSNHIYHQVLINNGAIASQYVNAVNSYALDALYFLGFKEVIISSEVNYDSLKNLVNDYYDCHQCYPNISLIGYGYLEMMVMKSCPIGTYFKKEKLHCSLCHQQNFYLVDKMNERYLIKGDKDCYTHIFSSKPLYLLDQLSKLSELHLSSIYINVLSDNDLKMIVNAEKNLSETNSLMNSSLSRGHFFIRPE